MWGSKWGKILSGIHWAIFLALLLAKIANERLKILTSLLFDLQTSLRGQNGLEFDQESGWHGPKHVTCLMPSYWPE